MFKKIASPILYAAFFIPTLIGTIFIINSLESTIGLSRITIVGLPETSISIVILGSILFWLANKLMVKIEKMHKPNRIDHFRQSSLYYLASFLSIMGFAIYGFHGGLGYGFVLIILMISVWAIIANAVFLYKRRKTNIS